MGDEEEQYELGVGTGWTSMSPTDVTNGLELYTPDDDLPEDIYEGLKPETMEVITPEGWSFSTDPSKLPQKSDIIAVDMTPEMLNNIIEMTKFFSMKCDNYEMQGIARDTVKVLDDTLNNYAVIRPWTPFLKQWLTSIDRYAYRKSQTGEYV